MRFAGFIFFILSLSFFYSPLQAGQTYDNVMKNKIIRVGVLTDSIPNAFYNKQKNLVGFEIDLASAIAKQLGCTVKFVHLKKDDSRITKIKDGTIDMTISNLTHTRDRDEDIDFSFTYFLDGQRILAPKGKFNKIEDFIGKRIATVKGTTTEKNLKIILKELGIDNVDNIVISYSSDTQCFEALRNGRVSGWTADSGILIGFAGEYPGKFELVGELMSKEPVAIGLPEDDSNWRDAINFALQDIWKDGTFHHIYNKWYGADTPYFYPLTNQFGIWKDIYEGRRSSDLPI